MAEVALWPGALVGSGNDSEDQRSYQYLDVIVAVSPWSVTLETRLPQPEGSPLSQKHLVV